MEINDAALGQLVAAVFMPHVPHIAGGILAIVLVLLVLSQFRQSLPNTEG